jgi:hypothetical protein
VPFSHIALPAGATDADTWQDDGTGAWSRLVFGPRSSIAYLSVGIDGVQQPDGSVRWSMYVHADDDPVTAEQAAEFADMLSDARSDLARLELVQSVPDTQG